MQLSRDLFTCLPLLLEPSSVSFFSSQLEAYFIKGAKWHVPTGEDRVIRKIQNHGLKEQWKRRGSLTQGIGNWSWGEGLEWKLSSFLMAVMWKRNRFAEANWENQDEGLKAIGDAPFSTASGRTLPHVSLEIGLILKGQGETRKGPGHSRSVGGGLNKKREFIYKVYHGQLLDEEVSPPICQSL